MTSGPAFSSISAEWNAEARTIDLLVDGESVSDLVRGEYDSRSVPVQSWSPFSHAFIEQGARDWVAAYRDPSRRSREELPAGELEIAVCPVDADIWCGSFAVWFTRDGGIVTWSRPHWAGDDEDEGFVEMVRETVGVEHVPETDPQLSSPVDWFPQTLLFRAADYDAAIDRVESLMLERPWPLRMYSPNKVVPALLARVGRRIRLAVGASR